jgi:hypothetical protein
LLSTRRSGLRARQSRPLSALRRRLARLQHQLHEADGITKSRFAATFFPHTRTFLSLVARALRQPGVLRISPVDRLKQIPHVCRTQRHHAVHRRGPNKPSTVEPLGVERQPDPVMPQGLDTFVPNSRLFMIIL